MAWKCKCHRVWQDDSTLYCPFCATRKPTKGSPVTPVKSSDSVNHPAHYGGGDNPYEAIKVIEAWGLGFLIGNVVKYIARAGRKGSRLEDLKKAAWYLNREIEALEKESKGKS